jgi:hypothetical protein
MNENRSVGCENGMSTTSISTSVSFFSNENKMMFCKKNSTEVLDKRLFRYSILSNVVKDELQQLILSTM